MGDDQHSDGEGRWERQDDVIRRIVREELAKMGGDLTATYGEGGSKAAHPLAAHHASHGAYLLQRFGGA